MKFQLTRPISDYDKLIEKYGDILIDYGFEEKRITDFDSEMKIKLSTYISFYDDNYDKIFCFININSLDELLELKRRLKCSVIIDSEEGVDVLEIYDCYRE